MQQNTIQYHEIQKNKDDACKFIKQLRIQKLFLKTEMAYNLKLNKVHNQSNTQSIEYPDKIIKSII